MPDADNNQPDETQQEQAQALCPNCLTPNDPKAHFCTNCATPMSSHACIDPIASIWARGDTWRKASSHPKKLIHLIGMWLLFGPTTLLFLSYLYSALTLGSEYSPDLANTFIYIVFILLLVGIICLNSSCCGRIY